MPGYAVTFAKNALAPSRTRAELVYKCFLLNIGMLTAKQITLAIAVTIMATIYSFDCATPYIKELPSVNKVGRYLFVLGSKPTI